MHAAIERNSWRLPPEDIVQVADPRSKKAQPSAMEEDLVYPGQQEGRNWRSIIFSLLVISLVIAGIVTAIYTLGYVDELLYWSGRRMTLDEFVQADLCPERLPPAWVSHNHFVFQTDDGAIAAYDVRYNNVTQLVSNHTVRQLSVKWFHCSSDLRFILLRHNVKQVFRNSFTAHYTIYDVTNDHHIPVRLSDSPKVQQTQLQLARWCGNTTSLVMVFENDIYVRFSPMSAVDHRLTWDGHAGLVYNGIPDWLYQEEIFVPSPEEALWCSPDGSHILYASFNDSDVRTFTHPWFGFEANIAPPENGGLFPASRTVRYPTPGTPNPQVRLSVINVTNTSFPISLVNPPEVFSEQDYYLISAGWVNHDNKQISAVWMNRPQNLSIISNCQYPLTKQNHSSWQCVETHAERAQEDAWLQIQPHPVFSTDGDSFLLLGAVQEGDQDVFTHIKHITLKQQRIAVLSHGRYQVVKILGWDSINHLVYYLGTHESKPGQRHLYVVRDPATDEPLHVEPECLTCNIHRYLWSSKNTYTNCSHFNAFVNPRLYGDSVGMSHYVLLCEGSGVPLAGVHSTTDHHLLKTLFNSNPQCGPKLDRLALPKMRSFEVPLPQGHRAQVQLLLPPSWREELRDAAYPVLVEVNGRPGSQSVTDKFTVDWGTYMSSKKDVVYVKLDVRGSAAQGTHTLSRKLGGVEVQDQITVLRYLLDTLKFLDRTRLGVWGWGYGGYVTAMVLSSQPKIFKCGIAVSPITDWLYYNSAFTERILGSPSENFKGYVEADATEKSKNIPSGSFFIIHGLADISAPYQHSVALDHALTTAGVMFRYQSYADQGHDLRGVREHVYSTMEEYWTECLSLEEDEQRL
ncbi:inactive dipeptidyl peptidase 10 isoform X2 [Nilaparvata lugens]|nr:inactive dipeptidyl peptidase 10 isoform X2 [Nilaparvata lugens]XP_039280544.1 inactive dipeptidyl peptidase 10 isoform X2 [Nilaparvata lugens]